MAGSFRADAVAQRMRSIAVKASAPAGRVSGVAYPWATPFAAGQAPAVRRQLLAIDGDSGIAFTGAQPQANLGRAWPPVRCASRAAVIRRQGP